MFPESDSGLSMRKIGEVMAVYAIGDIQGCFDELQQLLARIAFDSVQDRLWFAGDLVNRGPDSLAVLRFVRDLGERAIVVLGNHDLHLLALGYTHGKHGKKGTLDQVLQAPDRDELLEWLCCRPLMHVDEESGFALVHAGVAPQWDLAQSRACAAEVEQALQGKGRQSFLKNLYGDQPDHWDPHLHGVDRLRFITNCFTRLRFCNPDGSLALREKGGLGSQQPGRIPWFQVSGRHTAQDRIIFGHWSTLGYRAGENTWAIDSGCLWGGALTAVRIDQGLPLTPVQLDCRGMLDPHASD